MRINPINSRVTVYVALALLLLLSHATDINAQGRTSSVKGVVQSNTGEPLAGVSVVIRNGGTNKMTGLRLTSIWYKAS